MNDFLYKWQPRVTDNGTLVLKNQFGNETHINCSEGDTLFVGQAKGGKVQHIAITRDELYDILFNFMSVTELIELASKRSQYDIRQNFKPYTVKK
jgi:fibrillarin-like rRNA methylase